MEWSDGERLVRIVVSAELMVEIPHGFVEENHKGVQEAIQGLQEVAESCAEKIQVRQACLFARRRPRQLSVYPTRVC